MSTDPESVAFAGDESAFAAVTARHRRELHVHCYRMLASYDDADDAVQETFLRAWRGRDRTEEILNVRAWLYRIATNVCLDAIRRRVPVPGVGAEPVEVPWLTPYPDQVLDEVAPTDGPDVVSVDRETIELVFLVALQALPARQRATLIARDVLGWSAKETAGLLATSVPAANSALQRARVTMQEHLPPRRGDWSAPVVEDDERELLDRFIDAHQRCDAAAAIAVAAEEILHHHAAQPGPLRGRRRRGRPPGPVFRPRAGRATGASLPTRANRLPAAASYLRRPGDSAFRAFKLDVLRVEGDRIAEITTFGYSQFERFGLADVLAQSTGG